MAARLKHKRTDSIREVKAQLDAAFWVGGSPWLPEFCDALEAIPEPEPEVRKAILDIAHVLGFRPERN